MNLMRRTWACARSSLLAFALLGLCPSLAVGSPASRQLNVQGTRLLYNLDLDSAAQAFRAAIAADPADASGYTGLATALWAQIAYARGTMTADTFLGRIAGSKLTPATIAPGTAAAFRETVERAMARAEARVQRDPDDVEALYEYGLSVGLRASYAATIDGSLIRAFRAARGAFDAHERVLTLNPARRDAGLIVGTYRYLVATLSRPMRWLAYVAGFAGDAAKGLRLVEDAAAYAGDSQTDARLALVLLYNRERRYDDALTQLDILRTQFPRNRLVWLETGATLIRASRTAEADRLLTEGLERFANDDRPKMFGEEALWYYKRGLARSSQGLVGPATEDLRRALSHSARDWVHGRAHLELGVLAMKAGDQDRARDSLRQAVALSERDRDPATGRRARELLSR